MQHMVQENTTDFAEILELNLLEVNLVQRALLN